jgi:Cft2 family RNA processing exonuclease
VKITFYGAIGQVTGSCTHLHYSESGTQFLVDCGMVQGTLHADFENAQPFPFEAKALKFVLLTHAHLDHCGLIPRLYKEGFQGKVICTRATARLAKAVMLDSSRILQGSLYSKYDVEKVNFDHLDKREDFVWGKQTRLDDGLSFYAIRSAHILGACAIGIVWREGDASNMKSLLFSGDVGPTTETCRSSYLLKETQGPYKSTNYVVMESTKGKSADSEFQTREARLEQLRDLVEKEVVSGKRKLLIPAFSVHRMQEVLYDLVAIATDGFCEHPISYFPVYENLEEAISNLIDGLPFKIFVSQLEELDLSESDTRLVLSAMCIHAKKKSSIHEKLEEYDFSGEFCIAEVMDLLKQAERGRVGFSKETVTPVAEFFIKLKRFHKIHVRCESGLGHEACKIYGEELFAKRAENKNRYFPQDEPQDRVVAFKEALADGSLVERFRFNCSSKGSKFKDLAKYPSITLSSSGMCEGGIVAGHLKEALLNEDFTIVLTGYQAGGTNGSKLIQFMNDPKYDAILTLNDRRISTQDIKARIVIFNGYSGHASTDNMITNHLSRLSGETTRAVFLNHGDESSRESFKQAIEEHELTSSLNIMLPKKGESFRLRGDGVELASEAAQETSKGETPQLMDVLKQINQNLVEIKELLKK